MTSADTAAKRNRTIDSFRGEWRLCRPHADERIVLDGAQDALATSIRAIQLEMSLTTLYEGQSLAGELDAYIRSLGFALWDMVPGFRDPKTLRLMQYDGIYLRTR